MVGVCPADKLQWDKRQTSGALTKGATMYIRRHAATASHMRNVQVFQMGALAAMNLVGKSVGGDSAHVPLFNEECLRDFGQAGKLDLAEVGMILDRYVNALHLSIAHSNSADKEDKRAPDMQASSFTPGTRETFSRLTTGTPASMGATETSAPPRV
jgi:hypothetical protein